MAEWEEESPSEDEKTEIENQLYSMFYYHSTNDVIPDDLADKFFIDVNDDGASISLKQPSVDCRDHSANNGKTFIDGRQDILYQKDSYEKSVSSSDDESLDDFVKLPSDSPSFNSNVNIKNVKITREKQNNNNAVNKKVEFIPNRNLNKSRYFSQVNETCSSPAIKFGKDSYKCKNSLNNSFHLSHHIKLPSSTPLNKNVYKSKSNLSKESYFLKGKFQSLGELKKQSNGIMKKDRWKNRTETGNLTDEPSSKLRKKSTSDSVITISDSEEDDVVCLNHRNDSQCSSDSVLSCTSHSESSSSVSDSESECVLDNSDSIMLNTCELFDEDYCDISMINTNYDWRQTSSPDGWTLSMRKYYNKPNLRRLHFDYDTMIKQIREEGSSDWSICKADSLNVRSGRKVRCLRCQQEGHIKANCTKVFSCHMCGTSGHLSKKCPHKICLKCGSKHKQGFVDGCLKCTDRDSPVCNVCGIKGHIGKQCTNAWRSLVQAGDSGDREGIKYCCHCGKSGHLYESCSKISPQHRHYKHIHTSSTSSKCDVINNETNIFKRNNVRKKRREHNSHLDKFIPVTPRPSQKKKNKGRSNLRTKKKHIYHRSLFHDVEPVRKKKLSQRALLLRNAKKYKHFKKRLSNSR